MKKHILFLVLFLFGLEVNAQIKYIGTQLILDRNCRYNQIQNGFILLKTGEYLTGARDINSHTIEVATNNKTPLAKRFT